MTGRILLLEPDQAARSVVSLALGADGRAAARRGYRAALALSHQDDAEQSHDLRQALERMT